MANRQQLNTIITTISERYNIDIAKLEAIVSNNGSKITSKFASPIAKQKWEESGKANSELFSFPPSHKKGYTLKDVNQALGIEEPVKLKAITLFDEPSNEMVKPASAAAPPETLVKVTSPST